MKIHKVADLLQAFMAEESSKLAEYRLSHGPTIGAMYEGLTADIAGKAIPPDLDLQIVSGFVVDASGKMSGQIDCMLVRGTGESIPHTNSYKWPIWDVLAVFEVKKTLSYSALKDAFVHLRSVYDSFTTWFRALDRTTKVDLQMAMRAFGQITGVHTTGRTDDVPEELQLLHYTLCIEQLSPVRILWAYDGYKTQTGLRDAMVNFLEQVTDDVDYRAGFGVPCFPQLISCNGISLLKANGQPYRAPMLGEYWPFLVSSMTNPVWLMLELLWSKIQNTFKREMPFHDGLVQETFSPLLSAKPMTRNGHSGWYYKVHDIRDLDDDPVQVHEWRPQEISDVQAVIVQQLGAHGHVDTTEEDFVKWIVQKGLTVKTIVEQMQATGLVAFDGKSLHPTTGAIHTVFLADGRCIAGDNFDQLMEYVRTLKPLAE